MMRRMVMLPPRVWLILIFLFCFTVSVFPLDPSKSLTQYTVNHWNDENGLPQNTIRAILQTKDGYLWIGTEEGLVRFDGFKFVVFNDNNTRAFTNNSIRCLFEDSKKNLWIGTMGGGLIVYRPSSDAFQNYGEKDGLTNNVVYAVIEDKEKNIWIGTETEGIFSFDGKRFIQRFSAKNGLPQNYVRSLSLDHEGTIWVGTRGGLTRIKHNKIVPFLDNQAAADPIANAILEDAHRRLWIATGSGLFRLEQEKLISVLLPFGIGKCKITALYLDRSKSLWIATEKNGILRLKNDKFSILTKDQGLPDNQILAISEDNEGSLWIGSTFSGLIRLKDEKFTSYTTGEGLSDNIVFPIFKDRSGSIWIGTNNGLNCYKNGEFIYYTTQNGLTHNTLDGICQDSLGNLWVATDKGLNLFQNSGSGFVKKADFLPDDLVLTVTEDREGYIWTGSLLGIKKLSKDGKIVRTFTEKDGLASKVINFIFNDKKGNLWISTNGAGLTLYKGDRFILYTEKDGLASNSLNCIYEDSQSVLWLGSNNGLTRMKDGKFTRLSKKEGLYNNNIYQILEDKSGYFWMSSNKGIFRALKNEVNAVADGKQKWMECEYFDKEDGMKTSECNGGFQNAGCKANDGKLWFPTTQGVAVIDPDHLKSNTVVPPVYIESILLDGVRTDISETVRIPTKVKRVEIHFTAVSFLNPKKVKFKYKMEGYDVDWINGGNERAAYYTNLDGGAYRFRVIACNNDGLWNEAGAVIPLVAEIPFWKSWWFILITLITFSILSYVIIAFFRKYITLANFWKRHKYMGKFRLMEKIGSGGMGTVYKALNLMDKSETVALKVLREDMFTDENNVKRFKQEAAIIDQLDHPNIIKIFERGQSKNNLFIAMELLEGITLSQKIKEDKRLKLNEAVHIMSQISDALLKIHSKNIIHRDLKPDNIMLITKNGDSNFVKLLDFGLARTQYQTRLTQTGVVMGTINYMASEQISGKGAYAASDVYSLGVIFYEMLTGEKPFMGETTIDTMRKIIEGSTCEISVYRTDISAELNRLIMKMMNKDKDARPRIEDVLHVLHHLDNVSLTMINRVMPPHDWSTGHKP